MARFFFILAAVLLASAVFAAYGPPAPTPTPAPVATPAPAPSTPIPMATPTPTPILDTPALLANKCAAVSCPAVTRVCDDGFVAVCNPVCDNYTGVCFECEPDCTGHQKPKTVPAAEPEIKCSSYPSIRERIKCRINLTEENEYDYLPEECRTARSRQGCLATYKAVQACFDEKESVACARARIGLGNIAQGKALCSRNDSCAQTLKTKVFDLVKFRIYNLEYRAQEMKHDGVDEELIADFITAAELKKQQFNEAQTVAYKKVVVQDVMNLWKDFAVKAKIQRMKENGYDVG